MNIFPSRSRDKFLPMPARGQAASSANEMRAAFDVARASPGDAVRRNAAKARFLRRAATIDVLSVAGEVLAWISVSPKSS
jgi:hypothetical protein